MRCFQLQLLLGAPFLLHETLGCPIANLHSARSDLWEPQFVLRPTAQAFYAIQQSP
jgi:hypothetical protein